MSYNEEDYFDFGESPDSMMDFDLNEIGIGNNSNNHEHIPHHDIDGDITQYMILSYLSSNPNLWSHCSGIIETEYFDKEYKPVVDYIRDFEYNYNRLPSSLMIHAETGVRLDNPDDAMDKNTFEYISRKTEGFCRHKALFQWLLRSSNTINADSPDRDFQLLETEIKEIINIRLHQDMGFEVHDGLEKRLEEGEEFDGISTGFSLLDEALSGGVSHPSLNLMSGDTGDGKSIMLSNLAINYAENGYNVIFYTLELPSRIVLKRLAAMMTNIDINLVTRERHSASKIMEKRGTKEGKIWLHKMPVSSNVADIRAHYNNLMLESELEWPIVIVDYIGVMKPVANVRMDNIHIRDKHIAEELLDFAHDGKCPKILWSAAQHTKGTEKEKERSRGDVAGGADVVNVCDNLVMLKRTDEDQIEERTWGYIQKARSSGAKGLKVPISWNSHTQRMTDGDRNLFEEANPRLFGKKFDSDRISNDTLMKDKRNATRISAKHKTGSEIRNKLVERFKPTEK